MDPSYLPKVKDRFFSKLLFVGEHVIWNGTLNHYNNPVFGYHKNSTIAPWILYQWYLTGERPETSRKSALCGRPQCINPEHMGSARWANQTSIPVDRYRQEDELVLEAIKAENRAFMDLFKLIDRPDKHRSYETETFDPTPGIRALSAAINRRRTPNNFRGTRCVHIQGDKFLEKEVYVSGRGYRTATSYGRTRDKQMCYGHTETGNLYDSRAFIRR